MSGAMEKVTWQRTDIIGADLSALALHSRYRRHPGFSAAELLSLFRHELLDCVDHGGLSQALLYQGRVVAVLAARKLEWDSQHFGLPMGRVVLSAAEDLATEPLQDLILNGIADSRVRCGVRHFSLEVDIDDYLCLNAALANRFEIMDIKRTYCARRLRDDIDFIRLSSRVRPYRHSDHQAVLALLDDVEFVSRFSRDRFLDQTRSRLLYRQWFDSLLIENGAANLALVFERGGRIAACGVIGETDFSSRGIDRRMFSGGLFAAAPGAAGAYIPVMYSLTTEAARRHGIVDTTVSLNNTAPCRVLDSFRSYSGTVTRYSLRLFIPD